MPPALTDRCALASCAATAGAVAAESTAVLSPGGRAGSQGPLALGAGALVATPDRNRVTAVMLTSRMSVGSTRGGGGSSTNVARAFAATGIATPSGGGGRVSALGRAGPQQGSRRGSLDLDLTPGNGTVQTWIVMEYCDKGCLQVGGRAGVGAEKRHTRCHAGTAVREAARMVVWWSGGATPHPPTRVKRVNGTCRPTSPDHLAAVPLVQDAIERGWLRTERSAVSGRPNMAAVLATAREVAAALAYLHSQNVVRGAAWRDGDSHGTGGHAGVGQGAPGFALVTPQAARAYLASPAHPSCTRP